MLMGLPAKVDQRKAAAGRDVIAGDQNTTINNFAPFSPVGRVEALLAQLTSEIETNVQAQATIEKLKRFHRNRPYDEIEGLEAKLQAGNRAYEWYDALEMKEMFAKLLERFSLYASAQEILAHLLARAEYNFVRFIYPQIGSLTILEVNGLVDERIIEPTIRECGASVFNIDHSIAMGMIYWLADQCYVRWHQ